MSMPIVISYGCPRTGTTFMQKWLEVGTGYLSRKMHEGSILHPIHSADGLVELQKLFGPDIVFVRTYRDPIDIFKSFYVAQYLHAHGAKDHKGRPYMKHLAESDDDTIIRFIETEDEYTTKQRHIAVLKRSITIIDVDFGKLGNDKYCDHVLTMLVRNLPAPGANKRKLQDWYKRNFGVKPVRPGALSHGLVGDKLPSEIQCRLNDLKYVIRFKSGRPGLNDK